MLADDPLLFGLDMEDDDIVMLHADEPPCDDPIRAGDCGGGAASASLREENETLKLQARARGDRRRGRRLTCPARSCWS